MVSSHVGARRPASSTGRSSYVELASKPRCRARRLRRTCVRMVQRGRHSSLARCNCWRPHGGRSSAARHRGHPSRTDANSHGTTSHLDARRRITEVARSLRTTTMVDLLRHGPGSECLRERAHPVDHLHGLDFPSPGPVRNDDGIRRSHLSIDGAVRSHGLPGFMCPRRVPRMYALGRVAVKANLPRLEFVASPNIDMRRK